MAPRSKSNKSRKALEKKERKLLEAKIKACGEKCEEGRAFLEPTGKNAQPNFVKAMSAFEAAIGIFDGSPEAYFLMGECFREQGEHEKAIERYTQCLSCDPKFTKGFVGRAASYMSLRNWTLAFEDYSSAIRLDPDSDHVYNLRGLCTLNTRVPGLRLRSVDFKQCISDFKTAIRLNEANYYAWANIGRAYEDQGLIEEALSAYSSAMKLKEDYRDAQLRHACLALRTVESRWENDAKDEAAVIASVEAVGLPKTIKNVEEEVRLEMELAAQKQHEEELLRGAVKNFQALMVDGSDKKKWDPYLPLNLGICYLLSQDLGKAEEEFKIVTEIINARPSLVAEGEAEPIQNVEAIETVLALKKKALTDIRERRFLA